MLPTAHPHTLPQDMPNQDILPEDMTDAELVGCPCCDGLTRVPALRPGEQALCSYCGQPLSHHRHHALDKVIAYAITALILLITANVLPFLTLQVTGIENVIDLPSTSISLLHKGMPLMAMVISPLRLSLSVPWLITTGRLVFSLQNWCMVDVFLLALVVSLVKLATMATVILGLAFWAYVAFVWCFTLMLTCIDRLQCWRLIETLTPSDGGTGP
jgi:paraquat-inducible protein A